MASPIYGTGIAGYMDILAGSARGMNESQRLQRMQEKQDYSRAYQMIGRQDQVASRDQARQSQYDWNAYNAQVKQQQINQDYDWSAYDRYMQHGNQKYQRGIQDRRIGMQDERFKWQQKMDLLRMMPQQGQKPLSGPSAIIKAKLEQTAATNEDPQARAQAASALQGMTGREAYAGVAPGSQEMGFWGKTAETAKATIPPFALTSAIFGGDSPMSNIRQGATGYTPSTVAQEQEELTNYISGVVDYAKRNNGEISYAMRDELVKAKARLAKLNQIATALR